MGMSFKIPFSRKCPRCKLRYPRDEKVCPYCNGLTDKEVRDVRSRHESELAGSTGWGQILLYIIGLLAVGMLIYVFGGGW